MDMTFLSGSLFGVLLALIMLAALFMIPLGLPGLWLMLLTGLLHSVLVPTSGIGLFTMIGCTALVVVAEILEYLMSARYTQRYGGSKRASWGAILGGLVGAFVGVPVPVIGPLIGAFAGAFAGAFVGELTVEREERGSPQMAGKGALIGRAVGAAIKTAVGVVVAAWFLVRAFA